jgi:hypothetical protein
MAAAASRGRPRASGCQILSLLFKIAARKAFSEIL